MLVPAEIWSDMHQVPPGWTLDEFKRELKVLSKARVFETLNFFGKGLTQIETDVQLL